MSLPEECLCSTCPNYEECVKVARNLKKSSLNKEKLIETATQILTAKEVDPEHVRQVEGLLKQIKSRPDKAFDFALGGAGLVLGLMFADILKTKKKRRRKRNE